MFSGIAVLEDIMKVSKIAFAALVCSVIGITSVYAASQLNPKAISIRLPDQITWVRNTAGTAESAVLYGEPTKPGLYVVLWKWLPGNMSRPHWHPNDRIITVLKGTWWVGTGDKFDPDSTTPVQAGSYVTHFGKEIHYDGAKSEEVWLLVTGEGPEAPTPASSPPPLH
jgi:quercetin dioxygenase-like cupin family protein